MTNNNSLYVDSVTTYNTPHTTLHTALHTALHTTLHRALHTALHTCVCSPQVRVWVESQLHSREQEVRPCSGHRMRTQHSAQHSRGGRTQHSTQTVDTNDFQAREIRAPKASTQEWTYVRPCMSSQNQHTTCRHNTHTSHQWKTFRTKQTSPGYPTPAWTPPWPWLLSSIVGVNHRPGSRPFRYSRVLYLVLPGWVLYLVHHWVPH